MVKSGLQLNGQPWEEQTWSSEKQRAFISLCCHQLTEGEGVGGRGHDASLGRGKLWPPCVSSADLLKYCLFNTGQLMHGN